MSQKNETLTLVLALLVTAALLGGGWFFFRNKLGGGEENYANQSPQAGNTGNNNSNNNSFSPPSNVPDGTTVSIAGSTSMVQINQALKNSFEQQFPNTRVETQPGGTDKGIELLAGGNIDLAAVSRPLTQEETSQGLVPVAVAADAIAVVVSKENVFSKSLTEQQVRDIFQGKISNWSELGGGQGNIKAINRPPVSGTRQFFQEVVLQGGDFGNGANFEIMQRDATTPILQKLGGNGISYATYAQVANQGTVRVLQINGLNPNSGNYPFQRELYYVYKEPASEAVKAFLGYVGSPEGQSAIAGGS
ncbi:MAG: extracellular solute-binding protein [Spirulinaceae cyanobacterium]